MLVSFLAAAALATPSKVEITHVGGPTVLIEVEGVRIVTDPTFDDGPREYKGSVVLNKTGSPAITADAIGKVDLILLSHDEHADNLDEKGRTFLKQSAQVFTTVSGAERLGGNAVGLRPWESKVITAANKKSLKITAVPARHGPAGIEPLAGDVTGFVISSPDSKQDIMYVTGDTVWYQGTEEVAKRFKPGLVLAFAGSAQPMPIPIRVTMDANEVVEFAHAFPKSTIIPIHQDGWSHFKQSKTDIEQVFETLKLDKQLLSLTPGKKTQVPGAGAPK
ncbi:MAG: MBL fold metallo-hydrolase [Proteobacteria bacterium]|nr:MAG: MBL fold metallo-hydrolase [Pseudomonadota bacterium]